MKILNISEMVKFVKVSTEFSDAVRQEVYGADAHQVQVFNTCVGIISWAQLIHDLSEKKVKKAVMNQSVLTAVVVGYNLYYQHKNK